MKLTKSGLREMIRECLHEELSLVESSLSAEEKVDAWHAGTRRENYKAAGIPKLTAFLDIAKRKGYTEIVGILEKELSNRGVTAPPTATAPNPAAGTATASAPVIMDWDDLIQAADALLDELAKVSGNDDEDDGDGYWSAEVGYKWTMRKLYYTDKLNDANQLDRLCAEYSKKLPNVEFYYFEDDFLTEPVSEIGYTATNINYTGN